MSPDEGIADEEVSAYITAEDTGRDCWDRRLRVRHGLAVFMANRIRAHRASGEGGSPSALRASAPEGIDAKRPRVMALVPYADAKLYATTLREAGWPDLAGGFLRQIEAGETVASLADLDAIAAQAVKQAIPSAAAQPPPPEAFIGTPAHVDLWRAINEFANARIAFYGSVKRQEAVAWIERALEVLIAEAAQKAIATLAPTQAQARTPSAASAASAPEGIKPCGHCNGVGRSLPWYVGTCIHCKGTGEAP